jgi:hypothetical protein
MPKNPVEILLRGVRNLATIYENRIDPSAAVAMSLRLLLEDYDRDLEEAKKRNRRGEKEGV